MIDDSKACLSHQQLPRDKTPQKAIKKIHFATDVKDPKRAVMGLRTKKLSSLLNNILI